METLNHSPPFDKCITWNSCEYTERDPSREGYPAEQSFFTGVNEGVIVPTTLIAELGRAGPPTPAYLRHFFLQLMSCPVLLLVEFLFSLIVLSAPRAACLSQRPRPRWPEEARALWYFGVNFGDHIL